LSERFDSENIPGADAHVDTTRHASRQSGGASIPRLSDSAGPAAASARPGLHDSAGLSALIAAFDHQRNPHTLDSTRWIVKVTFPARRAKGCHQESVLGPPLLPLPINFEAPQLAGFQSVRVQPAASGRARTCLRVLRQPPRRSYPEIPKAPREPRLRTAFAVRFVGMPMLHRLRALGQFGEDALSCRRLQMSRLPSLASRSHCGTLNCAGLGVISRCVTIPNAAEIR
jgi:hypothetical protein